MDNPAALNTLLSEYADKRGLTRSAVRTFNDARGLYRELIGKQIDSVLPGDLESVALEFCESHQLFKSLRASLSPSPGAGP